MKNIILISNIIVIAFLVISLVGVISYIIYYNKNANKALKGERRKILIDKGPVLQVVSTIVIIALSITTVVKVTQTNNEISLLKNQISNLEENLAKTRLELMNLRGDFMAYIESNKNIYNVDYDYIDGNPLDDTIGINIKFSLRKIEKTSKVGLKVIDKITSEELFYELTGNGTYQTTIYLKINSLYDFYIVEENNLVINSSLLFTNINTELRMLVNIKTDLKYESIDKVEVLYLIINYSNYRNIRGLDEESINVEIKNIKTNTNVLNEAMKKGTDENSYSYKIEDKYLSHEKYSISVYVNNDYGTNLIFTTYVEK